jgi:hypothetical protein
MNTRTRTHWVHDYETLANCFVACFEHYKTEERKIFVIHELRNDIKELVKLLEENIKLKEWHISFNGLEFDSQLTETIIKNKKKLLLLSGDEIARSLYEKAQKVITRRQL